MEIFLSIGLGVIAVLAAGAWDRLDESFTSLYKKKPISIHSIILEPGSNIKK